MEMKMEYRLSGAAAVINDHPVPALFKLFLGRYGSGNKEQMADKLAICNGDAVDICNMFFGDDERMDRRLRVDIFKYDSIIVLMDDF